MALQQNTTRIQTTHVGSLPRPLYLLDLLKAKFSGGAFDQKTLDAGLRQAAPHADVFVDPAEIYVETTNEALRGIPAEKVRSHTCHGINEGPRIFEANLGDLIPYVLRINAGSYSFEAANPRHEHEYHVFEKVRIPDGKVICPGVITHSSNIVEHPEWIAERILRFARLAGRENVIAGAACGFSSQATCRTEVHETVGWEKFKALRQGADIASKILWKH